MKVLLVMTDQHKAAELTKACAGEGLSCQLADGGFYALTMLERDKPDAIVSSFDVSDMSGLDFYSIVRSDDSLAQSAFILLDENAAAELQEANDLALAASVSSTNIVKALKTLHKTSAQATAKPTLPKTLFMPKNPQISGTLEVLTLFDLIMSLNQNKHSGKLFLRIDENEAMVVLLRGEIKHAEMSYFVGEEALIQIFLVSEDSKDTEFFFERVADKAILDSFNSVSKASKELLFKVAVELDHLREKSKRYA